jgi:hypothetical protein
MIRTRSMASSGLVLGPLAWGLSTQANYSMAAGECLSWEFPITWTAIGLAGLALVGALLSFVASRQAAGHPAGTRHKPRTEVFLSRIGFASGLLFALVIALQASASTIFSGCIR